VAGPEQGQGRLVRALSGGVHRGKRLTALAKWHYGGGANYCEACGSRCDECPYWLQKPETDAGWQVWHLALRCGGQVRVVPGAVIGFDMGAVLAMGAIAGVPDWAIVEWMPRIEAELVRAANDGIKSGREG
jgi:hypothetical protein